MVKKLPSYFYLAFFVLLALFSFYFSLGLLTSQIESIQFAPNLTTSTSDSEASSSANVVNPLFAAGLGQAPVLLALLIVLVLCILIFSIRFILVRLFKKDFVASASKISR